MFRKILVANRGEIALRVMHACRELGIKTVAVYSTADKESLHVLYADEAVCIGPPPSQQSYLNVSSLIAAAEITGADAVHPGYGFLAENADFAEVLEDCKLGWIGPRPASIRLMGDKAKARQMAEDGRSTGAARQPRAARGPGGGPPRGARRSAYPIILKAAAGGGGRGMRIVQERQTLDSQFVTARQEAEKGFGSSAIYLEKYLVEPRHIEFQVFGDKEGKAIQLG